MILNTLFSAAFPPNQFIDPLSTTSGWVSKVANLSEVHALRRGLPKR